MNKLLLLQLTLKNGDIFVAFEIRKIIFMFRTVTVVLGFDITHKGFYSMQHDYYITRPDLKYNLV